MLITGVVKGKHSTALATGVENGMVSLPLEAPRSIFYGNGWHPDGWHPMGAVPEMRAMRTGRRLVTRITTSTPIRTSFALGWPKFKAHPRPNPFWTNQTRTAGL